MARQDQILEVVAAERQLQHQRMVTAESATVPLQQLRRHLVWSLPVTGLLLGYGFGVALRYRMLASIWYAASISWQLLPAALRWVTVRN